MIAPGAGIFGQGAAELALTALLIGFARAIQVVLDDGQIIDTLVHGLSVPLQALGPALDEFRASGLERRFYFAHRRLHLESQRLSANHKEFGRELDTSRIVQYKTLQ